MTGATSGARRPSAPAPWVKYLKLKLGAQRSLAGRWWRLDDAGWQRAEWRAKRAALTEALSVRDPDGVVSRVVALLDRALVGDLPSPVEWEAAGKAAGKAAWKAAWKAATRAETTTARAILAGLRLEIEAAEAAAGVAP